MKRLIQVARFRRVPVFVHWSVIVICLIILVASYERLLIGAVGLTSYLFMLLVHEVGHHFAAIKRGYYVAAIEIYPFHALCVFEAPRSAKDSAAIAWSGSLAQLAVAMPLIIWVVLFGYTRFTSLNVVLAILGFISFAVAAFNLLPMKGLDGKEAWSLFPMLWAQRRTKGKSQTPRDALTEAMRKASRK